MSRPTEPLLQRREAMVLAGLLAAGGLAAAAARRFRPVGEEVADSPVVQAVLAQPGPEAGSPRGDMTLLVFTDFNCGACRRAHPPLLEAVQADGNVRLRFLDWPIFGADSQAAAATAIAADAQGLYLPVHSALMQGGRADAQAAETALVAAGGDIAQLRKTLAQRGGAIEEALAHNARHAFALGLGGTPGHLIGRILLRGAASESEFRRAIHRARKLQS